MLLKDLGIANPVLVETSRILPRDIPDPNDDEADAAEGDPGRKAMVKKIQVPQFDFVLQFSWQETPLSKRLKKKQEAEKGKPADGNVAAVPAGT